MRNNEEKKPLPINQWMKKIFIPYAKKNKTSHELNELIKASFISIFLPEYYKELNESDTCDKVSLGSYLFQPKVLIIAFFGLPIDPHNLKQEIGTKPLTWQALARNFLGWSAENENTPFWKFLRTPLWVIKNSLLVISKTLWNTLTLFTEFIPRIFELLCLTGLKTLFNNLKEQLNHEKSERNSAKILGLGFAIVLLSIPFYIFKIWRIVGRTMTSPFTSMEAGLNKGRELGGDKGEILGQVLRALSFLITVTLYTLLFPLALKALMIKAPALTIQAAKLTPKILSAGASKLTPVLKAVSGVSKKVFGPIVKPIMQSLGLGMETNLASMTMGFWVVVMPVVRVGRSAIKKIGQGLSSIYSSWQKKSKNKIFQKEGDSSSPEGSVDDELGVSLETEKAMLKADNQSQKKLSFLKKMDEWLTTLLSSNQTKNVNCEKRKFNSSEDNMPDKTASESEFSSS